MTVQEIINSFVAKAGIETQSDARKVPAIVYCGDGGHLGSSGAYAADDEELGGFGDDMRLGEIITDDDGGTVAPIWVDRECVGFLVYDSQGLHYAEPSIAAGSGGHTHPLANALGIDSEKMFS